MSGVVVLVRHAAAASRQKWEGPDEDRPLNAKGCRQAEKLVPILGGLPGDRLLSSPAARCTATLVPLAEARGVEVEHVGSLREGRGDRALDLVLDLVDDTVLCTHGDVIDDVLTGLRDLGWAVPADPPCTKGSTWILEAGKPAIYVPAPS